MNYPVWQLDFAGGGLLIALIATIHVFIAQFAVGGGLFLVLTEGKARREGSPALLAYVKAHAKFFLLLTMVLGSLTGIGIWFTISLLQPAATSTLIHTFVFAWAVEWLFFLVEIVSLLLYVATFERLSAATHLRLGWVYAVAAWLSLFVISAIMDFMLTPGTWPQSGDFWSAFFNPTFWPALAFRSLLSLVLAGLFAFLTAAHLVEASLRQGLMRYCATWLLAPFVLLQGAAWWYRGALPPEVETLIFQQMPALEPFLRLFALCAPLLVLGGLLMGVRLPVAVSRGLALLLLMVGFCYLGAFEFIREGGRRPYIIRDYMYSNAIRVKDLPAVRQAGVLASARWAGTRALDADSQVAAGREIFDLLCLGCHALGGPMNDIRPHTEQLRAAELETIIVGMGTVRPFMPPFAGTEAERRALITFLTTAAHGRTHGP